MNYFFDPEERWEENVNGAGFGMKGVVVFV